MKDIEPMYLQVIDIEQRLGIMKSTEPVLENAIEILKEIVDFETAQTL